MGFLPEADQATTASGQAGPKKLPNRPPLPGEKLDASQQLAMDVMAQVVPAQRNLVQIASTSTANHVWLDMVATFRSCRQQREEAVLCPQRLLLNRPCLDTDSKGRFTS